MYGTRLPRCFHAHPFASLVGKALTDIVLTLFEPCPWLWYKPVCSTVVEGEMRGISWIGVIGDFAEEEEGGEEKEEV